MSSYRINYNKNDSFTTYYKQNKYNLYFVFNSKNCQAIELIIIKMIVLQHIISKISTICILFLIEASIKKYY